MHVKTQGLIIKEQAVGESDRLVTILTKDEGIIKAFAKRAKSLKDNKNASTSLLCYSKLSIFKGRDKYIIDNSSPIEIFFGLRKNILSLALAQYFCELCAWLVPENTNSEEFLRIVLNSLSFLSNEKKNIYIIKAITELRILSLSGYMPDLIMCKNCGKYENEYWTFKTENGIILCKDCQGEHSTGIKISQGVLTAMRHIIYSDVEKLYKFNLPDDSAKLLSDTTEAYTVLTLGAKPKTLQFFNNL